MGANAKPPEVMETLRADDQSDEILSQDEPTQNNQQSPENSQQPTVSVESWYWNLFPLFLIFPFQFDWLVSGRLQIATRFTLI